MSADLTDPYIGFGPHRLFADEDGVNLKATAGEVGVLATISRADFIAAVETELGVIVIDKADLPEVTRDGEWAVVTGVETLVGGDFAASDHRKVALGHLALATYLEANPPVDEANVARVIAEMRAADVERTGLHLEDAQYRGMVLRLLDAGLLATAPLATKDPS